MTREDLANATFMSLDRWGRLFRGEMAIRLDEVATLTRILGIDLLAVNAPDPRDPQCPRWVALPRASGKTDGGGE